MSDHEFLVRITIDASEVEAGELARLREAENRRAAELGASGVLRRLWRLPEGWSNCGLWHAPTEQMLRQHLASLPLHPWMTIQIDELFPHPSDPGCGRGRSLADRG